MPDGPLDSYHLGKHLTLIWLGNEDKINHQGNGSGLLLSPDVLRDCHLVVTLQQWLEQLP